MKGSGSGNRRSRAKKKPRTFPLGAFEKYSGNDLLSHSLTAAVPSAQWSLTSVFGMGTGVTSTLWSPETANMMERKFVSSFY
jgi:hypothetical protein